MSGSSIFSSLLLVLLIALAVADTSAQTGSSSIGPVVNAYLTGLQEELAELEFQLEHKEIARADYDLAKRRLFIVRRFVESYAAASREDLVPEFQVLADDELLMLGLKSRPDPNALVQGQVLDNQWRLARIERGKPRFFIFERTAAGTRRNADGLQAGSYSGKRIDPSDVIETIVVPERPSFVVRPRVTSRSPQVEPIEASVAPPVAEAPPAWVSPQVIFMYLPQYTDRARNSGTTGELIVSANFLADGRVSDVKLEKGLGMGLDQRSVDSVRRIGFIPGRRNGVDVDTPVLIIFNFNQGKVNFHVKPVEDGRVDRPLKGQNR